LAPAFGSTPAASGSPHRRLGPPGRSTHRPSCDRFRFFFLSREEERLHIHVQSADGEAKFWIEPNVELARDYHLSEQDLSRVLQLVVEHEQGIRDAWYRHVGR
jgi:hypothetical protein